MNINYHKPVWVYRNLRHGRKSRPLYSIMQNGRVLSRRHRLLLANVRFVVREAGRQRVLQENRKNVHAFAVGTLVGKRGCMGIDHSGPNLPAPIMYNPRNDGFFFTWMGKRVDGARAVLFNESGMTGAYLD